MNIDLERVGEYLSDAGLWQKMFCQLDEQEIRGVGEAIVEASSPVADYVPPYIENGVLKIPFRAPLKYRYWQGGQSVKETLEELGASDEVKQKYIPKGYGERFVLGVKHVCDNQTREKADD